MIIRSLALLAPCPVGVAETLYFWYRPPLPGRNRGGGSHVPAYRARRGGVCGARRRPGGPPAGPACGEEARLRHHARRWGLVHLRDELLRELRGASGPRLLPAGVRATPQPLQVPPAGDGLRLVPATRLPA